MHILIGFAIATLLIIGWARGNLFCCVFLNLGTAAGVLFGLLFMETPPIGVTIIVVCLVLTGIVWAPRIYLINRHYP